MFSKLIQLDRVSSKLNHFDSKLIQFDIWGCAIKRNQIDTIGRIGLTGKFVTAKQQQLLSVL